MRAAQRHDLDDLVRMEAARFATDRLSRRSFRALMQRPSAALLVAHELSGMVGYALVLTRRSSGRARLYSLAVDQHAAGRGIGGQLLGAVEAAAAERGAQSLRLEVRADNRAAIGLYEARGYRQIGRREGYYQDGMDAVRYERCLQRDEALPRPIGRAA